MHMQMIHIPIFFILIACHKRKAQYVRTTIKFGIFLVSQKRDALFSSLPYVGVKK